MIDLLKVLPFAGGGRVRIEATLASNTSSDLDGVELSARIEPWPKGQPLWEGSIGATAVRAGQEAAVTTNVSGLCPQLWSLTAPHLYNLTVTARRAGAALASQTVRFGFRSFETRGGQFLLNGKPIYLRGNSINPPGRDVPDEVGLSRPFAEAYIRDLKSRHVNLVRVDSDLWLDVCDELGMMVFAGRYGRPRGGTKTEPPKDCDAAIAEYKKEYLERYLRHPSHVISILSNEMPHKGKEGERYAVFFDRAHETLRQWDPNRLYIGNAGFGQGRGGEIYDQHTYWGWYGGDFLANYARLRDSATHAAQPWTFTECVGAYTTPEGRFSVAGKLLGTSLAWAGHRDGQATAALRYQAFLMKQFIEIQRRLRPLNPNLAGIMPFTIIWFDWKGILRFEDMRPKPVAEQMRISYQPVLLSWELWKSQVYAGAQVRCMAHLVNDAEDFSGLSGTRLLWQVMGRDGKSVAAGQAALPDAPYYQARSLPVTVALPSDLATGDYALTGQIIKGGTTISSNSAPLFVAAPEWSRPHFAPARPALLYDPSGKTAAALKRLGVTFTQTSGALSLSDLSVPFVVGEEAWDEELAEQQQKLRGFVRAGGRVLLMRPDPKIFDGKWLAAQIHLDARQGAFVNIERPGHPAFEGLGPERLEYWSDYTDWDQTRKDLPRIHPVTAYAKLGDVNDLGHVAVLADLGTGLTHIALCEVFDGKGSVILSTFELASRSGLDPVADRLLGALAAYAASPQGHALCPLIDAPIVWGDYPTERGVVVSPLQGLLVNQDRDTPRGRRPFGPFSYGGATGGYIMDPHPETETGWGLFHVAIPAGRTRMATTVQNPTGKDVSLEIQINRAAPAAQEPIPAGRTRTIQTPLPAGATDLAVRYAGEKKLILLKTAFE